MKVIEVHHDETGAPMRIIMGKTDTVNSLPDIRMFDSSPRMTKFDKCFLDVARRIAKNSHANRKKVGCVIVRDDSIISEGYNGTPKGFDNACEDEAGDTQWYVLHAESNAITKLARRGVSSEGATVYTTFSPCRECAKLLIQSGISRVVYTEQHSDTAGIDLLLQCGIDVVRYVK